MENTSQLFQINRKSLLSFANSILGNYEDAQDVVQEVFQECLERDNKDLNRSYLYKAVRSRSLNKIRSRTRLNRALDRFSDFLNLVSLGDQHESDTVLDLIKNLPNKQKEVLLLRIKAELKINEIAAILDIAEGTVKSRINAALKTIRRNIKEGSNEKR